MGYLTFHGSTGTVQHGPSFLCFYGLVTFLLPSSSPSFLFPLFFSKYYCGLYHQLNNGNYYKLKIITKLIKNVETKLTVNQNTVNKMIFFFSLIFFFFGGRGCFYFLCLQIEVPKLFFFRRNWKRWDSKKPSWSAHGVPNFQLTCRAKSQVTKQAINGGYSHVFWPCMLS